MKSLKDFKPRIPERMFSVMPMKILIDNTISNNALRIYGMISNMATSLGACYAKNEYFSKSLDVDVRTVSRSITELKDRKLIEVTYDYMNRRTIVLPFKATFQTNANVIPELEEEITPGVLEIVDEINARQKEKYPGYDPTENAKRSSYGVIMNEVILILAKSTFDSEFVGIKLGGHLVTEVLLKNLVKVFDVGNARKLVSHLVDSEDDVIDLQRYILTSLINAHKKELDELENQI